MTFVKNILRYVDYSKHATVCMLVITNIKAQNRA